MNVNDTKVWAPSNTGTKVHAFLGSRGAKEGNLRAACRTSIQRGTDARFVDQDAAKKLGTLCDNCVTLYAAAEDRAEASMQPATEAADLGYVAPVDERDEVQPAEAATFEQGQPVKVTGYFGRDFTGKVENGHTSNGFIGVRKDTADWRIIRVPAGMVAPHQPEPLAVGETIRVGHDELHRVGEHWADVTLRNGRRYAVSLRVRRKGETGNTIVLSDHVTYWSVRDEDNVRSAGEADRPGSVGGRIWHLLGAAHLV